MLTCLICAIAISAPAPQVIDGIRPAIDGMMPFTDAFAKYTKEEPVAASKKDYFVIGYFAYKARFMTPLVNTKYTAAVAGVCGTMLGWYDEATKKAIKAGADRIYKGTKDFDKYTEAEQAAIGKALTDDKTGMYPLTMDQKDPNAFRDYAGGMALGGLSAYVTLWHISPKHPTLLNYIKVSMETCANEGGKFTEPKRKDLAEAMKGFSKFDGKTLDEPTVREVGKQIELCLIASMPEKYRWKPIAK